ncbi:hypothetical protein C8Q76DRAFT_400912 [Earliella scabrosa]|nr:hypothetical protein C8Q76DRAFT_400912 [Earliella scabrosa]
MASPVPDATAAMMGTTLDSSFEDVSRDIFTLTSLMAGCCDPFYCRQSMAEPKVDKQLAPWNALAFILDTGHPSMDLNRDGGVAVTGHFDGASIKVSAFVTRNPSLTTHSTSSSSTVNISVQSVQPTRTLRNVDVLLKEDAAYPDFVTHVEDVLMLVRWCIKEGRDMASQFHSSIIVLAFIIRRNFPKLYSRLSAGQTIWGEHPIQIIHKWYQSDDALRYLYPRTFKLPSDVASDLSPYGLCPTSTDYEVSPANAKQWCDFLLHQCYLPFVEAFQPVERQGNSEPTPPTKSRQAASKLMLAMGLLNAVLVAGVVDHLITAVLADHFDVRYTEHRSTSSTSANSANGAGEPEVGKSAPAEELDLEDIRDPSESPRAHVIRYLLTVVTPYHSSRHMATLPSRFGTSVDVQMDLVTVNPEMSPVTPRSVQELEDSLSVGVLARQRERVRQAVLESFAEFRQALEDDQERVHAKATVHAEAALMGVVCGFLSGNVVGMNLALDDGAGPFPIGIGTAICCRACALLHEVLEAWRERRYPRFVSPEPHVSFRPWVPPPGLPLDILEKMRALLSSSLVAVVRERRRLNLYHLSTPGWRIPVGPGREITSANFGAREALIQTMPICSMSI